MNTPRWRKASRSDSSGNACVEVAALSGFLGVRDSKAPDVGQLRLGGREFRALLKRVKGLA
ncbi:DUF397 domain-containing protein [Actinomadura harenae]|uniref:DUF397 domain-containing protein n=1 Tax=Actinomadura harenae TaxID=2483351 RepID=A0A3M2LWW3_9ACTN|nr:DUF397 domain-containing protein [Actinomadura harenae]RMI40505.1 DUF397 domain-containing protein [Actinomadura harenae]